MLLMLLAASPAPPTAPASSPPPLALLSRRQLKPSGKHALFATRPEDGGQIAGGQSANEKANIAVSLPATLAARLPVLDACLLLACQRCSRYLTAPRLRASSSPPRFLSSSPPRPLRPCVSRPHVQCVANKPFSGVISTKGTLDLNLHDTPVASNDTNFFDLALIEVMTDYGQEYRDRHFGPVRNPHACMHPAAHLMTF